MSIINRLSQLLILVSFALSLNAQQTTVNSFEHDGEMRSYRLHEPANADQLRDRSLIINLHGFTSSAVALESYSGMNAIADRDEFFVCYPDGIQNQWNVGWAFNRPTDDVGFLTRLVDTLVANYPIREGNVYVCGMSNGGFMSYRLACEAPEKFAAFGSVTGAMEPQLVNTCSGGFTPFIQIHGTADAVVAYNGSGINLAVESGVEFWLNKLPFDVIEIERPVADRVNDGYRSTQYIYREAQPMSLSDTTSLAEFWIVDGGQHTWPGSGNSNPTVTYDFDASEELWRFFQQHSRAMVVDVEDLGFRQNPLRVYPNPSDIGHINIEASHSQRAIRILDILGKTQQVELLPAGTTRIDTRHLQPGVYWLVDEACESCLPAKIVLQ